jgi:hypothetical protein
MMARISGKSRWLQLSIGSLLLIVVVSMMYYAFYMRSQREKLEEYYLRVLSVASDNIEDALRGLHTNVRNAVYDPNINNIVKVMTELRPDEKYRKIGDHLNALRNKVKGADSLMIIGDIAEEHEKAHKKFWELLNALLKGEVSHKSIREAKNEYDKADKKIQELLNALRNKVKDADSLTSIGEIREEHGKADERIQDLFNALQKKIEDEDKLTSIGEPKEEHGKADKKIQELLNALRNRFNVGQISALDKDKYGFEFKRKKPKELETALRWAGGNALLKFEATRDFRKQEGEQGFAISFWAEAKFDRILSGVIPEEEFENIVILRPDGDVLFSHGRGSFKSFQFPMESLLRQAFTTKSRQILGKGQTPAGEKATDKPSSIRGMLTLVADVSIGGTAYKAFFQPVRIPIDIRSETNDPERVWVIVGLIKASNFRALEMSISSSIVLVVICLVLISFLVLPYLRIRYIGPRERIGKYDMIALASAILVLSSIVVYGLVHVVEYAEWKERADYNLKTLAEDIKEAFMEEINALGCEVANVNKKRNDLRTCDPSGVTIPKVFDSFGKKTDNTGADKKKLSPNDDCVCALSDVKNIELKVYPFMKMVFWLNKDGLQIEKWGILEEPTPIVRLENRNYFKRALERDLWEDVGAKKARTNCISHANSKLLPGRCVESIRSLTTGLVTAVLSRRIGGNKETDPDTAVVVATDSSLLSVIDPVMPAGYGFCIVDKSSKVLFHSESKRNLRETLSTELDDGLKLEAAMFSGTDTLFTSDYRTQSYRFYVRPLTVVPWWLVVFAEKKPLRATHLQILTFWLVLYVVYSLGLMIIFILLRYLFGDTELSKQRFFFWMWPDESKLGSYMIVVACSLLIIVAWVVLMLNWSPPDGILFTGLFCYLAFAFLRPLLLRVERPDKRLLRCFDSISHFCIFMILLILAGVIAYNLIYTIPNRISWAMLVICMLALVLYGLGAIAGRGRFLVYWFITCLLLMLVGWRSQQEVPGLIVFACLGLPVIMGIIGLPTVNRSLKSWCSTDGIVKKWQDQWKFFYVTGLFSLVVVLGVLPAVSFYRAVHEECLELFTKHGQLEMAQKLGARAQEKGKNVKRIVEKRADAKGDKTRERIHELLFPHNLEKAWDIHTFRKSGVTEFRESGIIVPCESEVTAEQPIVGFLLEHIPCPCLSDFSYELRALTKDGSGVRGVEGTGKKEDERKWVWKKDESATESGGGEGQELMLTYRRYRSSQISDADQKMEYHNLAISHPIPGFWPQMLLPWVTFAFFGSSFLFLLWLLIRSSARKLFLLDMEHPLFLSGKGLHQPDKDLPLRHLLVLRGGQNVTELLNEKGNVYEFDTSRLRHEFEPEEVFRKAVQSGKRTIHLLNFHEGLSEPMVAEKKLALVERLFPYWNEEGDHIIIYSDINPLHYLTMLSADYARGASKMNPDLGRWSEVLQFFMRIREPLQRFDHSHNENKFREELKEHAKLCRPLPGDTDREEILRSLSRECWPDPGLRKIASRLVCHPDFNRLTGEDQVIAYVLDLAEAYYRKLWSISSVDEKIVLYRLCRDGLVSWRSHEILRRLIHRGLVVAEPNFRLMNESFARFVEEAELPEVIESWEKEAGASTWTRLKWPLFIVIFALLVFFFVTQRSVVEQTLAVVGAIVAGGPVLIRLIGMIFEPRPILGSGK